MRQDRRLLVAMTVLYALIGCLAPHLPDPDQPSRELGLVHGLTLSILLFAWCKAHARAHSIEMPSGARLLVAALPPVGLPYYAFKGFGARKGARLLGMSLLVFVGLNATLAVCFTLSSHFVGESASG